MPEVGVYDSPEVNAFATGPSRKRSLVAVSTGILRSMDRRELEGVLAHEVSHIANGDMVTMTRESMVGALRRLMATQNAVDTSNPELASFKIAGGTRGFLHLFATHPPLELRIAALQGAR